MKLPSLYHPVMTRFMKSRLWIVLWLVLPSTTLVAQATPSRPPAKTSTPTKPQQKPAPVTIMPDTIPVPKFTVRFGPYNGSLPAPADDFKKIVGGDLTIADQRGQKWNPIAWRLIWNRKEYTDDIRTGRRKAIMTYNIVEVDSTAKIPAGWQSELSESLQSGEDLIFERIIIEHPGSKRKMFAAELRIKII